MNVRLELLGSVDPGVAESEVFRLALQHAVAELGALGGTIHLRGPMSALRLVSATGLPTALTGPWEIIDQEGPLAPARALYEDFHHGRGVWIPGVADERADPTTPDRPSGTPIPGSGLAAVPVIRRDRSIGALTVITGDRGEPTPAHWRFLRAVVAWTEERMAQAPLPAGPVHSEMSGDRLRQALKEVRVGSWDWHIKSGELIWDEAAMELYGTRPEEYTARVENWMRCVHPDDLGPTLALVDQAISGHSVFEAEYRVRAFDGTYGWHQARGRATYDEHGEPLRLIGMGWDSNESRTARDALSRALRHMSDGFLAVDDTWRITFANLEAERTLGLSEAELFGRVLWDLPTVRELPDLERRCRKAAAEDKSVGFDICVPGTGRRHHLRLVPGPDGRTLYLQDVTEKRRHEEERRAAEQRASERAARIAELTAALAKATTSRDVVDAVGRRVMPPFGAAGLIVQTIEDDRLVNVGSIGYSDDFLDRINNSPTSPGWPSWDVISSEEPAFFSSPEEFVARYPALARLPGHSGKQAWAFLPLTASGNTFGVCSVSFDSPRGLTDEDRTLLTTISALVAQALARARLYDAEHSRSRELQRGLLPRELPNLPACTAAARYLPAAQGTDVGGDWYDIIPLSGGQVALVVGDVMGHGLPQAATMGRLRTAVHTLADLELPPDEIMSHLNDIVGNMGEESYVTCLYALYDSITQTCSITRAGHPPPAVVHPDGTVYFPALTADPPLGAAEPPFETVELKVPEGSLLVLYTDGLVESSKREIDEGMGQLARLLREAYEAGTEGDLEGLCDTLTAGLLPAEQPNADDAALLVARLHALTGDRVASWPLPEDPRAAGQARRHVREQLSAWGLDDLTPTTELLASELVGNVVRHAKGPVQLRLLHGAELICEVFDGSLTMPRIRRATETDEGGRGLQLITALSQRWGTRYTPTGKCIWTEQALLPPEGGRGEAHADGLELMFLRAGDFDDIPELRGLGDLN
ncbi:SpoIIE family protein phosphatase [Streptomyces sp. WI04-05B]|uniref:SpoIIE family protein phosphatase n=1 Tax=Streptomyces TaxID=1883 RepID=UPI0029B38F7B|nr:MULTISPECIES: SpoIIE family protein phosphatase [unclassified Streptomyces]MDX2542809.1 SpoIIE family protein phosphatase [Streptomyces sp. WI04-05B]MDX2588353.1 SpoIIE family protein phosphatase [Streptomyces sp. WI04-05A]MDX3747353.1 SpoIIE family protein phosphatase [Streptomyces sp. AK08-02]